MIHNKKLYDRPAQEYQSYHRKYTPKTCKSLHSLTSLVQWLHCFVRKNTFLTLFKLIKWISEMSFTRQHQIRCCLFTLHIYSKHFLNLILPVAFLVQFPTNFVVDTRVLSLVVNFDAMSCKNCLQFDYPRHLSLAVFYLCGRFRHFLSLDCFFFILHPTVFPITHLQFLKQYFLGFFFI